MPRKIKYRIYKEACTLMKIVKELISKVKKVGTQLGFTVKHREELQGLKGHVTIKGYENGELVYSWAQDNVIVNTTSVLIASLLKGEENVEGIQYLAMGTGDASWSLQDPPAPTTSQTRLESEQFRVAPATKTYIGSDGLDSTSPTNIVDYAFSFAESEAVGSLVEMGLFGGDATVAPNTGIMVNYRTFPVINKTNSMAFTVVVRITA